MRRTNPSTCGWIVVDRSDRTVATNSEVRGTGLAVKVIVWTSVGGIAPGPGPSACALPPPVQAAEAATSMNKKTLRAIVMVCL
jgi:hypothetical protein